jgi:protein gp37
MAKSSIEWTESTWNPVTGCTKVSAGCQHCYAERMASRLQAMGQPAYAAGFDLTLHPEKVEQPLEWRKPSTIFVNSMSDLFHEDIPAEFILRVFDTMRKAPWHRFQVLTKRAERLEELGHAILWPDNVWMGVTVERGDYAWRVDCLRRTDAKVKFLSCEPLLGPLQNLNLEGVGWVIVGGESGPNSRPIDPAWVKDLRDQCLVTGVPFFFKQWGGRNKKKAGRHLEGRLWSQMPGGSMLCPQPVLPF